MVDKFFQSYNLNEEKKCSKNSECVNKLDKEIKKNG